MRQDGQHEVALSLIRRACEVAPDDPVEHNSLGALLLEKDQAEEAVKEFDTALALEPILCPRIHTKAIIMVGRQAFIGSANLTGAGLGAKGAHKRNFEAGFLTSDAGHLREIMDWIDQLYLGEFCLKCQRRSVCPDPIA